MFEPAVAGARNRGEKRAVLLLAHGTPDSIDQVPEYLRNITGGRPVPESVVREIRHRYSIIGPSPLTRLTMEQGRLLEESLRFPVYVGMRNWKPYIRDVIARMRADGVTAAVAICLAPQNSRTSVGLYRRAVFAEAGGIALEFVDNWAGHPKLAQAFAERLAPVWRCAWEKAGRAAPVLFTAHSVPCSTIQAKTPTATASQTPATAYPASQAGASAGEAPAPAPDSYPEDAKRTAANVAALLAPAGLTASGWRLSFQSQGMSGESWIGPTVEDTLSALAREGHSSVVIQPIGFLCDHIEILYDIDITFRKLGARMNLEVMRTPSLNNSPLLIEALTDLARKGFARMDTREEALPARSA